MGLLDDAIREHLDLKRKHGVAEEELQRQEEEALGPARREVAQQGEGSETAAEAEAEGGEVATTTATDEPPEAAEAPAAESADAGEPLFEADGAEDAAPSDAPAEFMPAAEDAAAPAPAQEPSGDTPPRGFGVATPEPSDPGATQEYDAFAAEHEEEEHDDADDLFADDEKNGESGESESDGEADVLEDTPDFLQETPEHDRLWFEQKPPRDFDFD